MSNLHICTSLDAMFLLLEFSVSHIFLLFLNMAMFVL